MPKSKKPKKDLKKDSDKKEDTPGPDTTLLFRNYLKECEKVGIETNETIKKALCQNENPAAASQLLLGPDEDSSPLIGDGGCRALVAAMLGDGDDANSRYTSFEEIRIWRSNIRDQGAKALSKLLSRSDGIDYRLRYLELSDNRIGALGGLCLGRSLCCGMNKTLLNLNLDFNFTLGSDGISSLAKGLKLNTILQRLSLRFCGIDEKGGESISEIISCQRSSIQSIDLEGNHLGGSGLNKICPGLQVNRTLTRLILADINLLPNDSDALESFGESISKHRSLMEINLSRNIIGKSGALAFSKHLNLNTTITDVKVDTSLDPQVYIAICRIPTCEKKKKKKGKKKK